MTGRPDGQHRAGGYLPAVPLPSVPQMLPTREVPPGDGNGGFFDFTGPKRRDAVERGRQGKYADAVKKAA